MVGVTFAMQIKDDCEAPVLDFDRYYHLLGMEKRNALQILIMTIADAGTIVVKRIQC